MPNYMDTNPETMTPGSAVADTLQNILAQQRADKHQQIVDSLTALNQQSEMNYRSQQAQSLAEDRAAQAAQRQALTSKAVSDAAANADFSKYLSGIDTSGMDPSVAQAFDVARRSPNGELMKSLLPAMMATPKDKLVPRMVYDEASAKFIEADGPDGKPLMGKQGENPIIRSRPPQGREAPQPSFIGTNADGIPVWGLNGAAFTTDETGKRNPYTGKLGPKPSTTSNKVAQIPPALLTKVTTSRGAYEQTRTRFNSGGDPGKRSTYNQAAAAAVSALNLPATVQNALVETLNDTGADNYSSSDIARSHTDLSPEDQQTLSDALTRVRGK